MNRALIVVDVQESFRRGPRWAAVSVPDIAARAGRLVRDARDRGETVVWVLHAEPGTDGPFDPASGHVRPMDGLDPLPGEAVLTKTTRNAFTSTDLQRRLTLAGSRALTVCGIQTEQCCETTTRVAADLGYDVDFVTEATATFPIPHRDAPAGRSWDEILADPRTLGTDAIVERTEYALAGRFATIRTLDEILTR
ncbi:isochorismatase family protein [Catenuloplanes atrovinosus]|uniref:Nicotinamidase-related amidase n=1 Tax=Catenuloplanes atrovinosus TaxID=137266 RepID=A0AAE3YJ45_9ACTN|nr:isochorismatase family protein [Catenuloplanes atrovinosus]MDR7274729.1 nicotinamidase-related amidase [Catenuloplanes atrovinosus]